MSPRSQRPAPSTLAPGRMLSPRHVGKMVRFPARKAPSPPRPSHWGPPLPGFPPGLEAWRSPGGFRGAAVTGRWAGMPGQGAAGQGPEQDGDRQDGGDRQSGGRPALASQARQDSQGEAESRACRPGHTHMESEQGTGTARGSLRLPAIRGARSHPAPLVPSQALWPAERGCHLSTEPTGIAFSPSRSSWSTLSWGPVATCPSCASW